MNAIETLYRNTGFVTEEGYIKVNDKLWVKSGPYERQIWNKADKSILPTKEELHEIYLKLQELIQIQEACGLESLQQIPSDNYPWVLSSTEYNAYGVWDQRMNDGSKDINGKIYADWIVPIRRTP